MIKIGFLVLHDTGAVSIKTTSGLFEADVMGTQGALNPGGNNYPAIKQCVNLKAYALSFVACKNIDDSDNIAGNNTRLGIGGATSIPITLSATFSRKRIEEDSDDSGGIHYTMNDANTVSYLTAWARRRTILLLIWFPNEKTSPSILSYGQEKDFFTSKLRTLYDVLWDKNLNNSSTGWHDSTYGTDHFQFTSFFDDSTDYHPCAIPIIIQNITCKETGSSKKIEVEVTGFVLTNEEEESN